VEDLIKAWMAFVGILWGCLILVMLFFGPVFVALGVYTHWLAMQALRKYLGKPPLRIFGGGVKPGGVKHL
jgi:hypothetical protein